MSRPLPQALQPHGIFLDPKPANVPPDRWTNGRNIFFMAGEMIRVPGEAPPYPPSEEFDKFYRYVHYVDMGAQDWWVGASNDGVAVTNGTNHYDITPDGWLPVNQTDRVITLGDLNTLPFVNHPEIGPYWWDGDPTHIMEPLPGWPQNQNARAMRAHKEFLMAIGIDTGVGGNREMEVYWSTSANPGQVPDTWQALPTNDAGDMSFPTPGGPVLDGISVRDQFFVMKANATFAMQYVGGQYVFQKRDVFPSVGIFSTGAVVEHGNLVYMLTGAMEFIRHDGNQITNLSYGAFQDYLNVTINMEFPTGVFIYRDNAQGQVVLCYPTDVTAACTEAIVMEAATGDIGIRDLPWIYSAATGLTAITPASWDEAVGDWDSDTQRWNEGQTGYNPPKIVFGSDFGMLESGKAAQTVDSAGNPVDVIAYAERISVDFDEWERNKTLTNVWPRTEGQVGDVMQMRFGSQQFTDDNIDWIDPQSFSVVKAGRLDFFVDGRLLAFSVQTTGGNPWKWAGMRINAIRSGVAFDDVEEAAQ